MPRTGLLPVRRLDHFLSRRSPTRRQPRFHSRARHDLVVRSLDCETSANRAWANCLDSWHNGGVVDVDDHPSRTDRLKSDPLAVRHLHFLLSRRVEVMASLLFIGAAGLVPWTVFLGLSLPGKYDAGHWGLLWTGFDGVLLAVLG